MHKDSEGVELKSSTREVTMQGPEQGKEASNWGTLRGGEGRVQRKEIGDHQIRRYTEGNGSQFPPC